MAAIRKATFLFVVTPDSANSEVCSEEIDQTLQYNKRMVPVDHSRLLEYAEDWKARSFLLCGRYLAETLRSL